MRELRLLFATIEKRGRNIYFNLKGGIVSFVQYLNETKTPIIKKPIYFHSNKGSVDVEIALEYIDTYTETVFTYANNINTREGGTHMVGFKSGLTRVINDYLKKESKSDKNVTQLIGR